MRQTSNILFIAVDSLVPARGRFALGLDEFTATLDHAAIPAVWVTSRSRLHFDDPRRKLGHTHPFIAEDGCAVYLPEDYFHLRPESVVARQQKASTLRLGRFTVIPMAKILPAASDALESLSEDTSVPVVTLRSLTPRELVQNTGLSQQDAELSRQRDFDEVFFFAGVSEEDIQRFLAEGRARNLQLRQHGVLWSIAIGASVQRCIRELAKLFDRSLRYHAHSVGIATPDQALGLFPYCEHTILLTDRASAAESDQQDSSHSRSFALSSPDVWEKVLAAVTTKN